MAMDVTTYPDLMLEAVSQLANNPSYILERQSKDPTKALPLLSKEARRRSN